MDFTMDLEDGQIPNCTYCDRIESQNDILKSRISCLRHRFPLCKKCKRDKEERKVVGKALIKLSQSILRLRPETATSHTEEINQRLRNELNDILHQSEKAEQRTLKSQMLQKDEWEKTKKALKTSNLQQKRSMVTMHQLSKRVHKKMERAKNFNIEVRTLMKEVIHYHARLRTWEATQTWDQYCTDVITRQRSARKAWEKLHRPPEEIIIELPTEESTETIEESSSTVVESTKSSTKETTVESTESSSSSEESIGADSLATFDSFDSGPTDFDDDDDDDDSDYSDTDDDDDEDDEDQSDSKEKSSKSSSVRPSASQGRISASQGRELISASVVKSDSDDDDSGSGDADSEPDSDAESSS